MLAHVQMLRYLLTSSVALINNAWKNQVLQSQRIHRRSQKAEYRSERQGHRLQQASKSKSADTENAKTRFQKRSKSVSKNWIEAMQQHIIEASGSPKNMHKSRNTDAIPNNTKSIMRVHQVQPWHSTL